MRSNPGMDVHNLTGRKLEFGAGPVFEARWCGWKLDHVIRAEIIRDALGCLAGFGVDFSRPSAISCCYLIVTHHS